MTYIESTDLQKDRYNSTLILFYCLGILTQVANNFILNAQLYWQYKFRDVSEPWDPASNNTNDLQNEFTADFSVVGNTAALIGLGIAIQLGRQFSVISRIFGCFCALVAMFAILILFVVVDTDTWQMGFLYMTLAMYFVLTCIGSIMLIALFQVCSKFTPNFFAAVVSGQAICGIFSSSVQILTLMGNGSPEMSGLIYFLVAAACVALTFAAFILSMKYSSFFRYHLDLVKVVEVQKVEMKKEIVFMVIKKQALYIVAMLLVFGATAAVHPSITSTVRSVDAGNGSMWNDTLFMPVITFFAYNVFDFIGRELAVRIGKPTNGVIILICSIFRVFLVPLLLMCNLTVKENTPVWFKSDALFAIFQIIFALTNGYATNICTISILKKRGEASGEAIITVSLLSLMMLAGNGIASFIGLGLIKIL